MYFFPTPFSVIKHWPFCQGHLFCFNKVFWREDWVKAPPCFTARTIFYSASNCSKANSGLCSSFLELYRWIHLKTHVTSSNHSLPWAAQLTQDCSAFKLGSVLGPNFTASALCSLIEKIRVSMVILNKTWHPFLWPPLPTAALLLKKWLIKWGCVQLERSSPLTLIEVTSEVITWTYLNEFGKHCIFYFKAYD